MNWQLFTGSAFVESLGWALVNSIWQAGLVSAVLFAVLRIVPRRASDLRYALAVGSLAIAAAMPVTTFLRSPALTEPSASISRSLSADENVSSASSIRDKGDLSRQEANYAQTILDNNVSGRPLAFVGQWVDRTLSPFLPFIVAFWFFGIALYSIRLCGGALQLKRYRKRAVSIVDEAWQQRFSELCEKLEIRRSVVLLRSSVVSTPIAIGVFKPLVLLPAAAFLQIRPEELETIIVHELIHIRRYDPLVNVIQNVIEVVAFYNPAIWWISAEVRREREFAADSAVLKIFDSSHVTYANALANLEEIRVSADQKLSSLAAASNGGNLMKRIKRILKMETEMSRANSAWTAGLAAVIISALLTIVFSVNQSGSVNAQTRTNGRKLAIGFVSIPPLDRSDDPPKDSDATARLLIAKLSQYKVPAIGFVTGSSISDGEKLYPVRANIVRLWRDAGLEVGIGGFNHLWFSKTGYDDYVANVAKNIKVTDRITSEKGNKIRYFSYPYLNTGKSAEDQRRFQDWLKEHGLSAVKYTIDNDEWMYSYAYDVARKDNDINTMKETQAAFIDYMKQMIEHYEAYSQTMFGRDIAQTMVLTSSRLVADSADELFGMLKTRGYKFVPMDVAQSDDAYNSTDNYAGDSGISWFERWMLAKGGTLLEVPKINKGVQRIWDEKRLVQGSKKKDS